METDKTPPAGMVASTAVTAGTPTMVPFDTGLLASTIAAAINAQQPAKEPIPPAETAVLLAARLALLRQVHEFRTGDLVSWKTGLRNKNFPKDAQPAIVVEVLSQAIIEERVPPHTTAYREPLDIILGVILDDGSFTTFYYDKRRFAPFSQ